MSACARKCAQIVRRGYPCVRIVYELVSGCIGLEDDLTVQAMGHLCD